MSIFRSDRNRMINPSSLEHAEAFDRDALFQRNEDPTLPPLVSRDEDAVVVEEDAEAEDEESS